MGFLHTLRVVHEGASHSAAMNMAIDEALLQTANEPILRFYGWRRPSLSFGYFNRFADVADEASTRELVRRWTGGGIVLHGDDLTYSFIVPRSSGTNIPPPQEVYRMIHGAIQQALVPHLEVSLARENAPKISDSCFANAVTADVLVQGRKIAGAAQRRTRAGLLHQGSIQHPSLPADFPVEFAARLCPDFRPLAPDPALIQRAKTLAREKYATQKWLCRR